MKRFLALAALVLGLAACQTEPEGLDVIVGGEVETTVCVSLPETTRANSAVGALENQVLNGNYSLRYILEVYRVNDDAVLYDTCQRFVETSDATTMVFPVRLAPGYDYRIVAWTDIIEKNAANPKADRCYKTTDGLDAVEIIDGMWKPMDETRDAYTAVKVIDDFSSASNLDMTLTRPFAKLRVVATDIEDICKVGLKPTTATAVYSQNMFFKYNAVADVENKGTANDARAKSHTFTYPTYPDTPVYEDAPGEYTLFADYFFVPSDGTAKFNLKVYAEAGLIKENNFSTEIFVQRNKLTTIKGDVLTVGGNVEVKVENELGELKTINYADNAETLQEIINAAPADGEQTNITLGGDIDLDDLLNAGILSTRASEPTYGLFIPAGKNVVLDLNGHTISHEKAQSGKYAMIENNGTLTICNSANTNGVISYGDTAILTADVGYASNTIQNNGTLTINEGVTLLNTSGTGVATYGYPHVIDTNGKLTINGGVLTNEANYSTMRIWCTTDDDTIITINGGTFNGSIDFQTPNASANKGTLTINGGTFNADTYTNCTVRLLGFGADVDEMNGYIKGGHFTGAIALKNWSGSELNSQVFCITGGTFTVDPSEFVDDDYNVNKENNVYTVSQKPYVIAKIGETEYRSLKKAVNNAVNGDTITFVMDVKQADGVLITDKNLTIDLNGKTFTITDGANTNNRNFKVNGTSVVTIKNGTLVAEGELTSGAYGTVRTEDTAVANLEDLKLYSYRGYGLNVKANTGTTINIKDSEIYAQYSGGVEAAGGNIELTNVKIDQKGVYSSAAWCSVAIGVNGGGKVMVNSGDYSASTISTDTNAAQGTWVAYVMSSGGTLDIKGGTFNGVVAETAAAANACGIICADRAAVVNIYGGTFNSNGAILDMRNNVGTQPNPIATLYAGTFSADPRVSGLYSSNLITVAAGSEINEANGIWTVRVAPVAMIGETEYFTLQDAFKAVNGETIVLYGNTTLNETVTLAEGKTAVLDLNGKTIAHADEANKYALNNLGTLTITGNGTINARGIYNGYVNGGENVATAKLTIENGTFNAKGTNGGAAVFNYGIADIKGGSFTSIGGYSLNNQSGASMTIADGVTANNGMYATGATVTINGGEISGNRSGCHVIYGWNANITINGGIFYNNNSGNATVMAAGTTTITYNGGTYGIKDGRVPGNGNTWTSCLLDSANSATAVINGGTYNGGFRVQAGSSMTINSGSFNDCYGSAYNISGTTTVKGGTYTDATAKVFANTYIAEGYEMNANGEVVAK